MQTNYLGPYLLTQKLLPLIISSGAPSKPSRIINVVSEAHYTCPPFDFEDINNTSTLLHPSLQYPLSKFLWVVATMGLADQLSDKNVVVHGVCPGITITEFWDKFPIWQKQIPMTLRFLGIGKTVLEAAEIVLLPTVSDDAELCTGVYWANMDKYLAQARVYDRELQTSIMEKTNKLLGL
jgi:NAD(P)-dependent dehydrogenase (short-subunit alcohol dehydrogenase family)